MIMALRYVLCFWIGPYIHKGKYGKIFLTIHTSILVGLYLIVRMVSMYSTTTEKKR